MMLWLVSNFYSCLLCILSAAVMSMRHHTCFHHTFDLPFFLQCSHCEIKHTRFSFNFATQL